ncbi:peptidase domain-containing ABC transporter [Flavobacterium sp. HBTb2-11-1]|uniref:peptidase domain-containing ABC transporter n=1 Tax=Flavobacterium sp. HBTb2-11-1 TaxID=2692212 RepID=UPI0013688090|nr:peptidase domain-containing ABC transporter [Flavobacterium sp. HBTb2-11-1]MXO06544.1 ATP-binding cassette domain-containing protein [Flavobacterium sp. HBTb2-11-1]
MISKHIRNTHTLQLDRSDCGVACLLSIIKFYKGNYSLEKLRELSGTTSQGTTMLGLYEVANNLGFDAEGFNISTDTLKENTEPAILQIKTENNSDHYVVCYEYDKEKGFIIGDPAIGINYISEKNLDQLWQSKNCLLLFPNSKFVTEKQIEKTKKKYFITLLRDDFKLLIISTIIGIFVAGLGMAMAIFSQKLIDDILPSNNINKLISGITLLFILLSARVGLSILRQHFLIQQSKDFNNRINNTFFSSLLQLPKLFFHTRKIGELIARLNDTQRIQSVIKTLTSSLVIDTLVALISLVFLFSFSWQLGIISLLSLPIYFYIIYRNNKNIIKSQVDVMQNYALTESNFINTIQGISTIKNYNKQYIFSKLNQNIFSGFQEKIFNLEKINISLSWQSGFASVLFLIGVLIYASIQVFNKEIKIGELMAILGIVGSLLPSIANLALISIPINEAKIAFNRMYEFASIEKENEDGLEIFEINKISIQNISFRFPGRSLLFHDLHIEIEKGKIIAIVGESGSGKSTLGQILKRFYPYEIGNITVNNKYKLSEIGLKSYRELLGVVPQEITIFNGNVLDNILLGATETLENMIDFIRKYGFELYFDLLPQGLMTIVGEEGINLSGGQKQIIALARALFKKPQFLILDEATSAMDRKTENFTIQLLQKIKQDCAVLFISHRLHKLRNIADTIYILENRTITKFGNHEELMKTDNFYSEYWKENIS